MATGEFEHEQEEAAAQEAGAIGGRGGAEYSGVDGEPADPAQVPLVESGQGEAEGFEQSEQQLVEHASHGDQHAARRVLEDAPPTEAEGDHERSGERPDAD